MKKYFYIYVLQSDKNSNFYIGYTNDLKQRLEAHKKGKVRATKNRLPLTLVYWEGCLSQADATKREKYLKTAWGKRYLKNRLKSYLEEGNK